MDTDIKGVVADEVVVVRPRKELWVNGQCLPAGKAITVPADFDLLSQCDIVVEEDELKEVKEEKEEKPRRKKADK